MSEILIRSYQMTDLAAIRTIHNDNALDFNFPNLNSSLWPVNKVLEVKGKVRGSYGLRLCAEGYLWLDKSGWTDAVGKWEAVKTLDAEASSAAAGLGLDSIVLCTPPGYERFGKRIESLKYEKNRPGWQVYSKTLGDSK